MARNADKRLKTQRRENRGVEKENKRKGEKKECESRRRKKKRFQFPQASQTTCSVWQGHPKQSTSRCREDRTLTANTRAVNTVRAEAFPLLLQTHTHTHANAPTHTRIHIQCKCTHTVHTNTIPGLDMLY